MWYYEENAHLPIKLAHGNQGQFILIRKFSYVYV